MHVPQDDPGEEGWGSSVSPGSGLPPPQLRVQMPSYREKPKTHTGLSFAPESRC